MMQRIMVLGLVPGTNYELSFETLLGVLVVALAAYRVLVYYAVHHYAIAAKYRAYRAEHLLRKNHLA